MGLAPATLYDMELGEFNAAYEGWVRIEEHRTRQLWELARWQSAVTISPHVKNSGNIMQMLPLPWDPPGVQSSEDIDIEERKKRAAEMLKYLKK